MANGTLTRVGVSEDESRKVKDDEGEHSAAAAAAAAAFHSPEESAAAVVSMIKYRMRRTCAPLQAFLPPAIAQLDRTRRQMLLLQRIDVILPADHSSFAVSEKKFD